MENIDSMSNEEFEKFRLQHLRETEQKTQEEYQFWRINKHLNNSIGLAYQYKNPMLINDVDNEDGGQLNEALSDIIQDLEMHKQFSFVLYGPPGVGKTYNAIAMMWQFINDTSLPAYFLGMQEAQSLLTSSWDNKLLNKNVETMKTYAKQAPLLIIDDLGAEVPSSAFNKPAPQHVNKFLYEIAEYRRNRNLPVILTSNLNRDDNPDYDQYKLMYDERTTSRLLPKDLFYWINLNGFRDRRS